MPPPRETFVGRNRSFAIPTEQPTALGPLQHLVGTWKSRGGTGWNMIALPYAEGPFNYRLLLNQFDETLSFTVVGEDIPNRGLGAAPPGGGQPTVGDQTMTSLDYQQDVVQLAAADSPDSGMAGGANLAIHHEPGLWLHSLDQRTAGLDIARLASVPHGDSVLALGTSAVAAGGPVIADICGLPIGITDDLETSDYLAPYRQFRDAPFKGVFDPTRPNALLELANQGVDIARTTVLPVDSTVETGGVVNVPFVVKQANATEMKATFWIQELAERNASGHPKLRLQYSQVVMLEFFDRNDGGEGLIKWPHVSINTLDKVAGPDGTA